MNSVDSRQLDAVVDCLRGTFGTSVVGVYLYGSAVLDDLHEHSDLDVLAVVDRPTTGEERRRLVKQIMGVSGSRGKRLVGRPVEVTVVRGAMVNPWRRDAEREFQYGEWLRADYEAGSVPGPERDADLAPLLTTVLTASVALVGPPAGEVLDRVPPQDLLASMRAGVAGLLADLDSDTTNVLLTLARMWHTTENGSIVSKSEAAMWALDRLPADLRPPLEHARAVYVGAEGVAFDGLPTRVTPTARHMSSLIRR